VINNHHLYRPLRAELTDIVEESPNISTFVLEPEEDFSFQTGQFIELTVDGIGEAPFTPSSSPLATKKLEVTVMRTGYVTDKLHFLKRGETLGIRGPYGRGYPLDKLLGKEILIVGGGCGFAPLRSLLYNLKAVEDKINKVIFCYGSKTPKDCIYKEYIDELRSYKKFQVLRSVDKKDNTWKETEGVVTVLLDKVEVDLRKSVAVVCGPPIMMKFGVKKLLEMGYPPKDIYLSMEKNMSCGFGKCGHCMMGKYLVCKDGPVFSYDEILDQPGIWD
jgi:NAD(P)H-flavin reductase